MKTEYLEDVKSELLKQWEATRGAIVAVEHLIELRGGGGPLGGPVSAMEPRKATESTEGTKKKKRKGTKGRGRKAKIVDLRAMPERVVGGNSKKAKLAAALSRRSGDFTGDELAAESGMSKAGAMYALKQMAKRGEVEVVEQGRPGKSTVWRRKGNESSKFQAPNPKEVPSSKIQTESPRELREAVWEVVTDLNPTGFLLGDVVAALAQKFPGKFDGRSGAIAAHLSDMVGRNELARTGVPPKVVYRIQ